MRHHFKWEIMKISSDVNKKYLYMHTGVDHHSTFTVEIINITHCFISLLEKNNFFAKVCV